MSIDYIPFMPDVQYGNELLTFQDMVDHVLSQFGLTRDVSKHVETAKWAVRRGLRDCANGHRWKAYRRTYVFRTNEPQTSGTVTYTHSTRTLTLSGATWPSWVLWGHIQLLDVEMTGVDFEIESKTDTTNIVLRRDSNPGADVAAGTSYRLIRKLYPLPQDFLSYTHGSEPESVTALRIATGERIHEMNENLYNTPAQPYEATIRGGHVLGRMLLEMTPAPDDEMVYHVRYLGGPRSLRIDRFQTTATVAGDGLTVTVADTLPEEIAGSIVRFSSTSKAPTGAIGENLYTYQRVIRTRASDTTFTIDTALGGALTSAAVVISDPVDIHPQIMQSYLESAIEYAFAQRIRAKDDRTISLESVRRELIRAKENDNLAQINGGTVYARWTSEDYEEYASS